MKLHQRASRFPPQRSRRRRLCQRGLRASSRTGCACRRRRRTGGAATCARRPRARARPGVPARRDRAAGAGPTRSRAADRSRSDAAERRPGEVHHQRQIDHCSAAQALRARGAAPAVSREHRRDLHADRAAHGPAARGVRRTRQAGQHRPAPARRLDHRLVGAERREQGDVRQVLREHQDGELRGRRRHDAGRAVGPAQRRRPGVSAQGGHADDRHEQQRRQHRA